MTHPMLSERQLDALRAVANVGAGHAATALSMLTRRRVLITVPKVFLAPFEDVADELSAAQHRLVSIGMGLLGDLRGRCLFLLREQQARALSDYLLERAVGTATRLDPMEASSLREAGNILGGAFAAALGEMMGMLLMLSVPDLKVHLPDEPCDSVLRGDDNHRLALSVHTEFHIDGKIESPFGYFVLATDHAGVEAILTALRVP